MSISLDIEIKKVLSSFSREERSEAALFLKVLDRAQDPTWHETMRQRSIELRDGKNRLPSDSVHQLDEVLKEHGL